MISWSFHEIFHDFSRNLPAVQRCSTAKVVAEKVSQGRTVVVREVRAVRQGGDERLVGGRKDGVDQAAYDYPLEN